MRAVLEDEIPPIEYYPSAARMQALISAGNDSLRLDSKQLDQHNVVTVHGQSQVHGSGG
jgi:hypothetical protein